MPMLVSLITPTKLQERLQRMAKRYPDQSQMLSLGQAASALGVDTDALLSFGRDDLSFPISVSELKSWIAQKASSESFWPNTRPRVVPAQNYRVITDPGSIFRSWDNDPFVLMGKLESLTTGELGATMSVKDAAQVLGISEIGLKLIAERYDIPTGGRLFETVKRITEIATAALAALEDRRKEGIEDAAPLPIEGGKAYTLLSVIAPEKLASLLQNPPGDETDILGAASVALWLQIPESQVRLLHLRLPMTQR